MRITPDKREIPCMFLDWKCGKTCNVDDHSTLTMFETGWKRKGWVPISGYGVRFWGWDWLLERLSQQYLFFRVIVCLLLALICSPSTFCVYSSVKSDQWNNAEMPVLNATPSFFLCMVSAVTIRLLVNLLGILFSSLNILVWEDGHFVGDDS